jgi:hypothetical protein
VTQPPAPISARAAAHVLYHESLGGYPAGSFTTRLLNAWSYADDVNAALLADAFPEYAAAFALFKQRDGLQRLRAIANGQ